MDPEAPDHPFTNLALARLAYEAYVASADGKNYQGLPCPDWDGLPEAIQRHWIAAVLAVKRKLDEIPF